MYIKSWNKPKNVLHPSRGRLIFFIESDSFESTLGSVWSKYLDPIIYETFGQILSRDLCSRFSPQDNKISNCETLHNGVNLYANMSVEKNQYTMSSLQVKKSQPFSLTLSRDFSNFTFPISWESRTHFASNLYPIFLLQLSRHGKKISSTCFCVQKKNTKCTLNVEFCGKTLVLDFGKKGLDL
jgi:hypothetical protein